MSTPPQTVLAAISLPSSDHALVDWTRHDGAFVNQGDTVALLEKKNSNNNATTTPILPPKISSNHRRPTRRGIKPKKIIPKPSKEKETTDNRNFAIPLVSPATGVLQQKVKSPINPNDKEATLHLGNIIPCPHAAVMDNLCAVCGQSTLPILKKNQAYLGTDDATTSQQSQRQQNQTTTLLSAGMSVQISSAEAESISASQTKRLQNQKKLSLVLDLDHTLVHATADPRASVFVETQEDVRSVFLPSPGSGGGDNHSVKLRPHVMKFLQQPHYEITVYTAGTRQYAEQVTMILSRQMVGATQDHADILNLKHRLERAEERLLKQKKKKKEEDNEKKIITKTEQDNEETTVKSNKVNGNTTVEEDTKMANSNDTTKDSKITKEEDDDTASPPKKRVRFGAPPPDLKTDNNNSSIAELEQEVTKLRDEWKEVQDMENTALQKRQVVFGSRIVSRTDVGGDEGMMTKSLKRIFPDGGLLSVIVDDREDVWANGLQQQNNNNTNTAKEPPPNLLLVQPYHWSQFSGFADINNASGADLTKGPNGKNEKKDTNSSLEEQDPQLLWTGDILERLHRYYYDPKKNPEYKLSVAEILQKMRREVLNGSVLVFSGVIPLHKQKHSEHPLIRYATSLGATVATAVTSQTTHVIAASDGTDKVLAARRIKGCVIVKTVWLMECFWSITRRKVESRHVLPCTGRVKKQPGPSGTHSNHTTSAASEVIVQKNTPDAVTNNNNDDDDDDDEDDFADELWDG